MPSVIRVSPLAVSAFLAVASCAHRSTPPGPVPAPTVTCPATWTILPSLEPALVPSDPSLHVVARARASGTQNYQCASSADAGASFAWTFLGPEAALVDCNGAAFGRHLASEGGGAAPRWEALDGSFVVAKKIAATPSREPGAVPWLLLRVTASSGSGALGGAAYVQRTATTGGAPPSTGCDAANAGAVVRVPYSADYWFLGM